MEVTLGLEWFVMGGKNAPRNCEGTEKEMGHSRG